MDPLEKLSRNKIPYADQYYDNLVFEVDPTSAYKLKPLQSLSVISINSLGFRGKEWNRQEEILLLGDSVSFGVGAPSDQLIFSRFLEESLEKGVADASVRAYRIFQHYARLPELLYPLPHAKMILLWGGYADLLYWVTRKGRLAGAFNFGLQYARRSPAEKALLKISGSLKSVPFLSKIFDGKIKESPGIKGSPEDLADSIFPYLEGIKAVGAARDLKCVFVFQPFLQSEGGLEGDLRKVLKLIAQRTQNSLGMTWDEAANRFKKRFMNNVSRLNLDDVIDAAPYFKENDFLDQVHLKPDALKDFSSKISGRLKAFLP